MSPRRIAALVLLSAYLLFILDLTWFQFPSRNPKPNLVPLRTIINDWRNGGREWVVNFLGNIAAFVPIGMIPAAARPGRTGIRHATLFCLGLSTIIEVVQYLNRSRVADVDDVLLNTAGGVLGYLVLHALASLHREAGNETRPVDVAGTRIDGPC